MKLYPFLIFSVSLALTGARAAETTAPALAVKSKSNFALDEGARNPFWPIGWKKSSPKDSTLSVEHVAAPEITSSAFVLSSVTMDRGTHFAIVNGKVMQQGQKFGLMMAGQVYEITVQKIEDGHVVLLYRDQEIPVSLRRK